jgi:hypothetical protein
MPPLIMAVVIWPWASVSLANPQALKQGLAGRARGFEPPVVVDIGDGTVDGAPVMVALVHECDRRRSRAV